MLKDDVQANEMELFAIKITKFVSITLIYYRMVMWRTMYLFCRRDIKWPLHIHIRAPIIIIIYTIDRFYKSRNGTRKMLAVWYV